MRYIAEEGRIVWSASDLKAAAECEFAWLRAIDARLGRVPAVEEPEDLTLERAGRLGIVHERRVLDAYVARRSATASSRSPRPDRRMPSPSPMRWRRRSRRWPPTPR